MKPYLSPKDLAQAIGASESSIKRWADDGVIHVQRTAGGHRRIERTEAIEFVRRTGTAVLRPELLGFSEAAEGGQVSQDWMLDTILYDALQLGREDLVMRQISGVFLTGKPLTELFDGPIRNAMTRIGEFWEHREDGIMIEHRATDICVQAVNRIRSALPTPQEKAPVAVGCAPSGDPYILPSLMAATVVKEIGFRETNLGAETPLDSLLEAARQQSAALVWLSVSTKEAAETLEKGLDGLASELYQLGALLVAGGQASRSLTSSRKNGQVVFGQSMTELSAAAKGLFAVLQTGKRQNSAVN